MWKARLLFGHKPWNFGRWCCILYYVGSCLPFSFVLSIKLCISWWECPPFEKNLMLLQRRVCHCYCAVLGQVNSIAFVDRAFSLANGSVLAWTLSLVMGLRVYFRMSYRMHDSRIRIAASIGWSLVTCTFDCSFPVGLEKFALIMTIFFLLAIVTCCIAPKVALLKWCSVQAKTIQSSTCN